MRNPRELFDERNRTIIVLAPRLSIELQLQLKLKWGCQVVSYRELLLAECLPGQVRVDTDAAKEARRVRAVADESDRLICLTDLDYVLAYFDVEQREMFWRYLREALPWTRSVVVLLLNEKSGLLPSAEEIQRWKELDRVVEWEESAGSLKEGVP